MKKLFFVCALVLSGLGLARAGEPVSMMPWPNSTYAVSNSTVVVSSNTVLTIAATSGFRAIHIGNFSNPGTTLYYRLDGSTASIPTVGWVIPPAGEERIESNAAINLQLAVAASSVTVRVKTFTK